jgi:hypothetical protein
VHRQGLIEGRELRRLGVDVNFSPVLDVLTDRYSPNIGIRSYGKDPALVARYGAARIRGLQAAGVSACAKHFPGKGHAPVDAHLGLPVIDSDWSEMHAGHLPPFLAAMEAGVDCIMTSHPLYPRLDPPAPHACHLLAPHRGRIPARRDRLSWRHRLRRPRDGRHRRALPHRGGYCPRGRGGPRSPPRVPHPRAPARGTRGPPRGLSNGGAARTRARAERGAPRRAPGEAGQSIRRGAPGPERDGEPLARRSPPAP